jgi:hypothetical protein
MNDDLTKDAKIEPQKRWQKIIYLVGMIAVSVFASYSLFEAYWTDDVLNCGKLGGCNWHSYQDSPGMFFFGVSLNVFLFLLSSYVLIDTVRRKMAGK